MTSSTVLLIDDNDDFRAWLATTLRDRGWQVIATRSGRAAIDLAAREQPGVVISELVLPDVRGLQLARTLRSMIEDDTTVIALTRIPPSLHERARTAGYDHVIVKPVTLEQLEHAMRCGRRPTPPVLEAAPSVAPRLPRP